MENFSNIGTSNLVPDQSNLSRPVMSNTGNNINQNTPQFSPIDQTIELKNLSNFTQHLLHQQNEADKRFESLNVRTSFQFQLLNERVLALEQNLNSFINEFRNSPSGDTSSSLQKKIELIGKHFTDLSSDITKLDPHSRRNSQRNETNTSHLSPSGGASAHSGTSSNHNSGVNVNNNITTVNNIPGLSGSPNDSVSSTTKIQTQTTEQNKPGPVQTTTTTTQIEQNPNESNNDKTLPGNQNMGRQPQIQNHQNLQSMHQPQPQAQAQPQPQPQPHIDTNDNVPSVESSSSSNIFDPLPRPGPSIQQPDPLSRPLLNSMSSFSDTGLMDINKQWSKALGIRSPGVASPFTPKQLGFDYPIPINRALSFNRQLDMGNESNLAAANAVNANAVSAISGSNLSDMPSSISETLGASDPSSTNPQSMMSSNTLDKRKLLSTIGDTEILTSDLAAVDQLRQDPSGFNSLIDPDTLSPNSKRRKSKSSDASDQKSPNSTYTSKAIQGVEYPQYKLEKGARNVEEIWREYEYGINGKPPLKQLEVRYNAKWRNDTELRTFVRRKKIYKAIENGKALGYNENEIIKELEDSRTYYSNGSVKKKPLSWLYTNIPEKYQQRNPR